MSTDETREVYAIYEVDGTSISAKPKVTAVALTEADAIEATKDSDSWVSKSYKAIPVVGTRAALPSAPTDVAALIAESRAHIANTVDGLPQGSTSEAIRRGEGADPRIALVVKLTAALESLSQTPEEQWEYAVILEDPNEHWIKPESVAREWVRLAPRNTLVRRRPAGDWLPVGVSE